MEECFVTAARRSIAGGGGEAITTLPMDPTSSSSSPLRWRILRQALINRSDSQSEAEIKRVSRKATQGFNLIPCKEWIIAVISMTEISNRHNIDNTGLVCQWPSEEVLAYLCMSQPDCFRGKRVIELGSGYGLAGLVIAAATEASEVVVSDENPQVVNCLWTVPCLLGFIVVLNNPYIKRNIESISMAFNNTSVKARELHWNQHQLSELTNSFYVIVANDWKYLFDKPTEDLWTLKLKRLGILHDTKKEQKQTRSFVLSVILIYATELGSEH
ncbi:hypothetical protein DY000_02017015 [Brassica cretica]|uniref:Calmodulin-lysine N-methyltransferase n=1 Tax=Brassica cretica TaxID=69181 RepID=A0ABQ7CS75_BRACR|nr:hypothetical protein DY000_02017015 [Brassica cretica]